MKPRRGLWPLVVAGAMLLGGCGAGHDPAPAVSPSTNPQASAGTSPTIEPPASTPTGSTTPTPAPAPSTDYSTDSSGRSADPTTAADTAICASSTGWIDEAVWVEVEGQATLRIWPTDGLRECGVAAADAGWAELVDRVPGADTDGMREQYLCHVLFAPAKEVWNIEPWRPAVDRAEMVRAGCNPGGPDPDLTG